MARFAYEPLGCFSPLHHIIRTTVVQGAKPEVLRRNAIRIAALPGSQDHPIILDQ
jgi:hypothetical protein